MNRISSPGPRKGTFAETTTAPRDSTNEIVTAGASSAACLDPMPVPRAYPWLIMSNRGTSARIVFAFVRDAFSFGSRVGGDRVVPATGTCAARDHTMDIAHTQLFVRKCSSGNASGNARLSSGNSASRSAIHPRSTASLNPTRFEPSSCASSLGAQSNGEPTSLGSAETYGHQCDSSPCTCSS